MGWTESDSDISGSRGELLDKVVRRGEQLRNRRRLAVMAAVPVLLVALFVPAALRGNDDPGTQVAASSPTVTAEPPSLAASPSTSAAPADSTTSMVPLTIVAPPTTVPTTTTVVRTTVANSVVPPPPTTAPGPEPTTTIPPTTIPSNQAPGTTCNPPMMTASVTTDKVVEGDAVIPWTSPFKVGDTVVATATWTNTSGATCWYKHGYWGNWVVDSTGKIVTPQAWPPFDLGEWRAFAPGETQSHRWNWDLTVCSINNTTVCQPAPPGTYKIIFDYEPFAEPTVTIQVAAS